MAGAVEVVVVVDIEIGVMLDIIPLVILLEDIFDDKVGIGNILLLVAPVNIKLVLVGIPAIADETDIVFA